MGYASSSRSVRSARSHAPPGTWPPPRGRVAVPVVAAPSVPCRPPTAEVFWSGNLPPQAPSGDALPCRRRLLVRPMVRRPSQRVKFPHSPVQWSSETNKYRIESFQCAQRNLDRTLSIVIYSRSGIRSADFIGILTWVGVELGLAAEDPTHSRRAWGAGRPIRTETYGKKREHGSDPADFEWKGLISFRNRLGMAVCCVQSWRAMDNVLYAIPGTTAAPCGADGVGWRKEAR